MRELDPLLPEFDTDRYANYRELRERAPVHRAPVSGIWCVSRFEDVQTLLRRDDVFSSRAMFSQLMNGGYDGLPPPNWRMLRFFALLFLRTGLNPFTFPSARNLIAEDGDSHAQLRAIVNRGFTPRRIASWEARARTLARECSAGLARGEPFELVSQLATPLPVTIIAEMLGIESERRADFKRWSDSIIHALTGPGRLEPYGLEFNRALSETIRCVRRVAGERRRSPKDDVLSAIVAQQDGAAGLSDREVVQFVILLLVAGNETTTHLIGNCVRAVLAHPGLAEQLAADPALAPRIVEETLRWESPVQLVFRRALDDVEIAGTRIPRGATAAALIGSANRDERHFRDPDRFDPDRGDPAHVGFGFGRHFCLGAALARLEARVALETLAPHLPGLCCDPDPERVVSYLVRGPRALALRPRAPAQTRSSPPYTPARCS